MAYVNNPAAAAFIPAAAAAAAAAQQNHPIAPHPPQGAHGHAHIHTPTTASGGQVGQSGPMHSSAASGGQPPGAAASNSLALLNMSNLINQKDSRWLQLEVCREFQRNKCSRSDNECKFAHPTSNVEVQNGRVTACYDSIKVRTFLETSSSLSYVSKSSPDT